MHWGIRTPAFRSFKNRLLILIVGLIGLAQSATLLLALGYVYRDVYHTADRDLHSEQSVLQRQLQVRDARMQATAEVLIADFGFKEAVASADSATIRSALDNQLNRIGATLAAVYTPDGKLLASSAGTPPSRALDALVAPSSTNDATTPTSFYAVVDGLPMQIVLNPLRAPEPIAWVAFGFVLDAQQESSLGALVHAQVRFITVQRHGGRHVAADAAVQLIHQGAEDFLALTQPLPSRTGTITLQVREPLAEAMAPYRKVRDALLIIAAVALGGAIGIALAVGRGAARPVEVLSAAVRRIEAGRYDEPVRLRGASEFVQLARSFNGMQIGLRDREQRIRYQSTHDNLTGLHSRTGLRLRLIQLLEQGGPVAIVLIDIHRFRDINASLERDSADAVLRAVATRLAHAARSPDLVGRLGADQFALLLETEEASAATQAVLAIAEDLRKGVLVAEARVALITRSGVSSTASGARGADDLMRHADVALLEAKERGVTVVRYEAGHDAQQRRSISVVAELRRAIALDSLTLAFQPLVRITDGELSHFEALVRWTHPTLGVISPGEFVPLAERASAVSELTHWVLSAVIDQLRHWRKAGHQLCAAINLSASDVADASLPAFIFQRLGEAGVGADQLIFEVTESAIMREPQAARQVMEQLRSAGSRFAVDDFGTGHSSLAQVHSLPIDELKIDRSFVQDLGQSERSAMIVRTVIELAHGLKLAAVAEGVETPEAMALLLRLGCDYAQGYLISRPIAADAVLGWLEARSRALGDAAARATEAGELIELRSLR
ncbi:MAG TPA: EAL domain-containing protein [Steroidobacteraceae bacterium]|nr:EAL domain-containing protein [Steroidobacteraceae bacterium]